MRADAIHGQIGAYMKKQEEILDWEDLCSVIDKSGRNIKVINMNPYDFFPFPDSHRAQSKRNPLPTLRSIVSVKFVRGMRCMSMYYKTNIKAEYVSVEILKNNLKNKTFEDLFPLGNLQCRGMNKTKKDIIIQNLVPKMPVKSRAYWESLPENDSVVDLTSSRDDGETSL